MPTLDRRQRGSILIWAVLALGMLGAFLALAITVGRMTSVRGSLQNGVDSSALAGAAVLDMTQAVQGRAQIAAVQYAAAHATDAGYGVVVNPPTDIQFGHWYREGFNYAGNCTVAQGDACFLSFGGGSGAEACPPPGCQAVAQSAGNVNAIRVSSGREAGRAGSPAMPVAFGGAFLPQTTLDVRASAIAVGGGPCEAECPFPLVFADCDFEAMPCNWPVQQLRLYNDPSDDAGLTTLNPAHRAGVPYYEDAITCARSCGSSCPVVHDGDTVTVDNGTPLNPISRYEDLISLYGERKTVPILHFSACPAHYVGDHPTVGFGSIMLCFVNGSSTPSWANWADECGTPPAVDIHDTSVRNSIFIRRICPTELPGSDAGVAGCDYFGTSSPRSRLVR